MNATSLLHVSLTVGDLAAMRAFYTGALGFTASGPEQDAEPALAALLGAGRIRTVLLRRGAQTLELAAFDPPGASYPSGTGANDLVFQHVALVTDDIAAACERLRGWPHAPMSRHGPSALPGGIVAFKFRDPEGHPLELIQFPNPDPATAGGIDHSAIAVGDAARSIAFYTGQLGLAVSARQVNTGPAQDALDGLGGAEVDVVALSPARASPHLELLGYRRPPGRPGPALVPADIAASRLVFRVDRLGGATGEVALEQGGRAALLHDPDGHRVLLVVDGKEDAG